MAQRLGMNFVGRRPLASGLGWVLLVAGVLTLMVSATDWITARTDREAAQARLQVRVAPPERRVAAPPPASNELDKVRLRTQTQMAQPWARWLDALEGVEPGAVALIDIQLQSSPAQARVTGEARDMGQALRYLERLQGASPIRSVVLASHEQVRVGEADVLRFVLDLQWEPLP